MSEEETLHAEDEDGDTTTKSGLTDENIAAIDAQMKATFGDDVDDEPDPEPEEEKEDKKAKPDSKAAEDDAPEDEPDATKSDKEEAADGEDDEDSTEDDDAEDDAGLDSKTLNALKSAKLDAAEIAELAKKNPEVMPLVNAIREMRTREGKAYGTSGRKDAEITELKAQLEEAQAQRTKPKEDSEEPDESDAGDEEAIFDPDIYGEEPAKALTAMQSEMKELRAERDETRQFIQTQQERQQAERLDKFFAGLDGQMYPEFGDGKFSDLRDSDPDAPEFAAMQKVVRLAVRQQDGAAKNGEELSDREALDDALHLYNPDAKTKAATRVIARKVKKRSKQLSARPTRRSGGPPSKAAKYDKLNAELDKAAAGNADIAYMLKGDGPVED